MDNVKADEFYINAEIVEDIRKIGMDNMQITFSQDGDYLLRVRDGKLVKLETIKVSGE